MEVNTPKLVMFGALLMSSQRYSHWASNRWRIGRAERFGKLIGRSEIWKPPVNTNITVCILIYEFNGMIITVLVSKE